MADQRVWRMAGHVLCLTVHLLNGVWILYVLRVGDIKDERVYRMFAHSHIYLTVWNMIFQKVYFAVNILCDIQEMSNFRFIKDKSVLKFIRISNDIFFDSLMIPATLTVAVIFWPVFLYNRELLFPAFIDDAIGKFPNYIMHGFIVPALLWELRHQKRTKPITKTLNLILVFILCTSYVSVIVYTYSISGLWPYPFLHHSQGTVYLHLIIFSACLLTFVNYFVQWPLRRYIYKLVTNNKND